VVTICDGFGIFRNVPFLSVLSLLRSRFYIASIVSVFYSISIILLIKTHFGPYSIMMIFFVVFLHDSISRSLMERSLLRSGYKVASIIFARNAEYAKRAFLKNTLIQTNTEHE